MGGRTQCVKCGLEWVGTLGFTWPQLAVTDDFMVEAGQAGARLKEAEVNWELRMRLVKSRLREGPEVGVASTGSGTAGTLEEVASYQLCP